MSDQKYKATPVSRNAIRQLAAQIRKITGTENTLYFPIIHFVECVLPQLVDGFFLEILPKDEMPNKCGETFPAEKKIQIREDIYQAAIDGDGFARYSVAHEVGHLLINDVDSISLCRLEPGERLKPYEDPEWQADAFGGELLMYYPLIHRMSEDDIAEKCGVTRRAAHIQKSKAK